MSNTIEIDGKRPYYSKQPDNPRTGDIFTVEDYTTIRAYVFDGEEWKQVIGLQGDGFSVTVEYVDIIDDLEGLDDVEMNNYQYRLGI